ncbi:hypothetical protein ACWGF3_39665 [Streptomyces xanthophaeus]|uniref:Uncharacterized protein n=1 Tax=Streptomyces xanthophaeus TaxID=67385 RepID=A0A919GWM1_9ACTN|nr:hypothetical protein Sxan_20010 [Streptomyces xanthophaeus]
MHPYDSSRAPSYPSAVPPMRPARDRDSAAAASHTPIYDTLYSEYLRAFRALPGDRTGEEDLGFTAFSYGGGYGAGGSSYTGGSGWNSSAWQQSDSWQPSYTPQPSYSYAYAGQGADSPGYAGGRQNQTGMTHIPAALPPAPRRGY